MSELSTSRTLDYPYPDPIEGSDRAFGDAVPQQSWPEDPARLAEIMARADARGNPAMQTAETTFPVEDTWAETGFEDTGETILPVVEQIGETAIKREVTVELTETDYAYYQAFVDSEGAAYARQANGAEPIDPAQLQAWFDKQDPLMQASIEAHKVEFAARKQLEVEIHRKLTAEVPELYEAHLPKGLAELLEGKRYVLGFNQSDGASSGEEAGEYLQEHDGVGLVGYDTNQRFLLYEHELHKDSALGAEFSPIQQSIEKGYYNLPDLGRFVAVFPVDESKNRYSNESVQLLASERVAEDGVYIDDPEGGESISSKYIAGFIDGEGNFWTNVNFMKSTEPDLQMGVIDLAAQRSQEQGHEQVSAQAPNRPRMTERERQMDESERRNETYRKWKNYVEQEAIDPKKAVEDFKDTFREKKRDYEARAAREGRELNDRETAEIRNLEESVNFARKMRDRYELEKFVKGRATDLEVSIAIKARDENRPLTDAENEQLAQINALRAKYWKMVESW